MDHPPGYDDVEGTLDDYLETNENKKDDALPAKKADVPPSYNEVTTTTNPDTIDVDDPLEEPGKIFCNICKGSLTILGNSDEPAHGDWIYRWNESSVEPLASILAVRSATGTLLLGRR